jgi:two-component sensor histidine kinase
MDLFEAAEGLRRRPWIGYALAVLGIVLALGVRLALGESFAGSPFLAFFPVVILTTFFGGSGAGVFAAVICGFAAWYFILEPAYSWALSWPEGFIALGFYTLAAGLVVAVIHLLNTALAQLRDERTRTRGLLDQQRTMFTELQHRTANNMMFVGALLALQKRKLAADPASAAAAGALDEARARLETMSRIHRRLYDPSSVNVPVGQYLQELCSDILDATGSRNIVCMVEVPQVALDMGKLLTLSLIVAEVVTNSLKHGFAEGEKGTVSINLESLAPDRYALTIKDNGRGLPQNFDPTQSRSLGYRIVQSLAAQLQGEFAYLTPDHGTTARISFPA